MLAFLVVLTSCHALLFEMRDVVHDTFLEHYQRHDEVSGSFFVVRGGAHTVELSVWLISALQFT